MNKQKKLLIVLLLIVLALGALACWQRNNLKALYMAKTMDADTILASAAAQTEKRQKELERYGVTLPAPTREEIDALLDGRILPEILLTDEARTNETDASADDPSAEQMTEKDILERCIQKLYECEAVLMVRLGAMKQAALDEWHALEEQERTKERKRKIILRGLDDCYELEVEIDAQVLGILDEHRAELKAIRADTAPIDILWKHYCDRKASEKAYYINQYL